MSICVKAIVAEKKAVKAPIKEIIFKNSGTNSNINDILIKRYTPAVTIVAAWIRADTGVGPSIASGNQVCNPIWADFDTTPINKNKQIKYKKFIFIKDK